jgi:sialic acid synthase
MRELVIDGVRIADDTDCYVIAEIGHNHQGNLETCKRMFDAAKWAGCNAVKLQKRDNKTLYTEEFYNSPYNSENAYGPTYGLHREALEFDWGQYVVLKSYARTIGITFFATAFDVASVDFLVSLGVPAIKIASGDLKNRRLLDHLAGAWDRPVIVSTGGSDDIYDVDSWRVYFALPNIAVLHCTSGYPARYEELNLRAIESYREHCDCVIGWSAHDTGIAMAPVAYALGARIIEKHFTLNRAWKGTDQSFSLEPQGMKTMIDNLRDCKAALGDGIKRRYASEIAGLAKQRKNAQGQIDGLCV